MKSRLAEIYDACVQNPSLLTCVVGGSIWLHSTCLDCGDEDATSIVQLIELNPDVISITDDEGYLPIHCVSQRGCIVVFDCLYKLGPQHIQARANNGRTPLHFAAQNRHISLVKRILKLDPISASLVCNEGRLPLHLAAAQGCLLCTEALLKAFPQGAQQYCVGHLSPLRLAVEFKHYSLVEPLFRQFPAAGLEIDDFGLTPLLLALMGKQSDISRLLLRLCPESITICQTTTGQSSLHMACYLDDDTLVQSICSAAPQLVSAPDHGGFTPLHVCAHNSFPNLFKILHGVSKDALRVVSHQARSVLHFAAQRGNVELIDYILQQQQDGMEEEEEGRSLCNLASEDGSYLPVHLAAFNGHNDAVLRLLEAAPATALRPNIHGCLAIHTYLIGDGHVADYRIVKKMMAYYKSAPIKGTVLMPSCVDIVLTKMKLRSFTAIKALADIISESGGGIVGFDEGPQIAPTVFHLKAVNNRNYMEMLRDVALNDPLYDVALSANIRWLHRSPAVFMTLWTSQLPGCISSLSSDQRESGIGIAAYLLQKLSVVATDVWRNIIRYL